MTKITKPTTHRMPTASKNKPATKPPITPTARRKAPAPEAERPRGTLAEVMRPACGVITDSPTDFATNKFHLNQIQREAKPCFRWPAYKAPSMAGLDHVAVLTDAVMLTAFFCARDAAHKKSRHLFGLVNAPCLVSREVLDAAASLIASRSRKAWRLLEGFVKAGVLIINPGVDGINPAKMLDEWLPDSIAEAERRTQARDAILVCEFGLLTLPAPADYEEPVQAEEKLTCWKCGAEIRKDRGPLAPCIRCSTPNAGARWTEPATPEREEEPEPEDQD